MTNEDREFYDKLGICLCCLKAKRATGYTHCPECLERFVLYQAKRRASTTPEMKAEENAKRRELYNRRREAGLCPHCGKPATHGIYCYEHSIKIKRYNTRAVAHAKQKRHDRGLVPDYRKANHLCIQCGTPIEAGNSTMMCNACRARMSEWSNWADHTQWRRLNEALWTRKKKNEQINQSGQAGTRRSGV